VSGHSPSRIHFCSEPSCWQTKALGLAQLLALNLLRASAALNRSPNLQEWLFMRPQCVSNALMEGCACLVVLMHNSWWGARQLHPLHPMLHPRKRRHLVSYTPVSQTLQTSSPAPWASRLRVWACCPCLARLQAHTRMPGGTHQAHPQTHGSGTCCRRCLATAAAVSNYKVQRESG
jgi:hypothetical protein